MSLRLGSCVVFVQISTHRGRIAAAPPAQRAQDRARSPSSSSRGSSEADVAIAGFSEHSAQTPLEQPVLQQEPR